MSTLTVALRGDDCDTYLLLALIALLSLEVAVVLRVFVGCAMQVEHRLSTCLAAFGPTLAMLGQKAGVDEN